MNGTFKHPLRVGCRLVWLAGEMAWIALNYLPRVALQSGGCRLEAKARWLQWGCRRVIKIFRLEIYAAAAAPRRGLLVSNHLSYLDVLVFSALTPSVFVAKQEVKHWPVFGWFAKLAGTVFVDRRRRLKASASAKSIQTILEQGVLVILFPEGTSSNGRTLLSFKSALLEPAATFSHAVSASAIEYRLGDGDAGEEVCYWKDMTLVPHLLNLLSKDRIKVFVNFTQTGARSTDRKQLARDLHFAVLTLKLQPCPLSWI